MVAPPTKAPLDITTLDPEDVLSTEQAAELLEPLIKPLPPFNDSLLPATA